MRIGFIIFFGSADDSRRVQGFRDPNVHAPLHHRHRRRRCLIRQRFGSRHQQGDERLLPERSRSRPWIRYHAVLLMPRHTRV